MFSIVSISTLFLGCNNISNENKTTSPESKYETTVQSETQSTISTDNDYNIVNGTEIYRNFTLDNILKTDNTSDIHFNLYVPESYNATTPYALYITLPGYEGLYFQGVGVNLQRENFAFEAQKYNDKMIIVAPQLNGWDETSADETIILTEYLLSAYNIDKSKVYINGYSGGGETASIAVSKRPDLFTAYLQVSSQWDGEFESVAKARLPIYIAIGRDDEYYGSNKSQSAYDTLYNLYKQENLTDSEIEKLLILDIKEKEYFTSRNVDNEHGGGGLFAEDKDIMSWLFGKH